MSKPPEKPGKLFYIRSPKKSNMTIGTIFVCICISFMIIFGAFSIYEFVDPSSGAGFIYVIGTIVLVGAVWFGGHWYCNNTASGQRALIDQKSELQNGIERTITVYTADGKELAQYQGKIDIDNKDGYVKFDFDGKRYIYYNCFVESVADID